MRSNLNFLEDAKKASEFITTEYNESVEYERITYADRGLLPQQQFERIQNSYVRAYLKLQKIESEIRNDDDGKNHSPLANSVRAVVKSAQLLLTIKINQLIKLKRGYLYSPEELEEEKGKLRKYEKRLTDDHSRMYGEMDSLIKYSSASSLEFFRYDELVNHEESLYRLRKDIIAALAVELKETDKKGFFNKPNFRLVKERWEAPLNKVNVIYMLMNQPYKSRVFADSTPEEMDNMAVFEYILREYVKALSQYLQWQVDFWEGILNKKISIYELNNNSSPYYMQRIQLFKRYETVEASFDEFRQNRINRADELIFE